MFAILGNIVFEPLNSPQSFDSSRGWTFAEHKTIESTPKLQWIGNELEELTLDILLHVLVNNPAADRAALYAAADAHQAQALIWGDGTHRGYFVITGITETASKLGGDGSIIALTMKLKLKQWARQIEIDPNAPPIPTEPTPGIVTTIVRGAPAAGVIAADGTVSFPAPAAGTSAVVNNPAAAGAAGSDPSAVPNASVTRRDSSVGGVLV